MDETIRAAIAASTYDAEGSDRTVTELVAPPRIATLRRGLGLIEPPERLLYALEGQVMHGILERAGSAAGQRVEERIHAEVRGWDISGQFDLVRRRGAVLRDWKYTSVVSGKYPVKDDHVAQLNVLRWLLSRRGEAPEMLEVGAFYRDWRPGEAKREDRYPPKVHIRPVTVWPLAETAAYVDERVALHQAAQQAFDAGRLDEIPDCSRGETWGGRRCEDYCVVSLFDECAQYRMSLI